MKSNMKGLKAMFKKLSPAQKKEMMSAKYGMEKPLMKMGGEGMLDMSKQMEANMRYGGKVPMTQKQMGGEGMGRIGGLPPERLRPKGLKPDPNAPASRREAKKQKRQLTKALKKSAKQKARSKRYGGGTASTYSGPKKRKK